MPAVVAWLDSSADEQRRIRELVALFSQRESRDELGLGQVRDVLSGQMFPGTSVLLTRARYLLIVPWVFQHSARRGRSGAELQAHAANTERRLIEVLRAQGDTDGLIGRLAGKRIKLLPSALYWGSLRTFGILLNDKGPEALSATTARSDEADELAVRHLGDWDPTMPSSPDGFPGSVPGGLDLTPAEAAWLRERVVASVPGTLMGHLMQVPQQLDVDSTGPWDDHAVLTAPEPILRVVRHAELFSLAVEGASLLYNLLIAERYEAAGYSAVEEPVQGYRDGYADWWDEVQSRLALAEWDGDGFWSLVLADNPRISLRTRFFVDAWVAEIRSGNAATGPDNDTLRGLVAQRERLMKGPQSRLENAKLLGAWSGGSGTGRMVYRWPNVKRIVNDTHVAGGSDAAA